MDIILASESKYKKKLLLRILDEFNQIAPHINETSNPGESAPDLAIRLALQKGVTLLENNSDSIMLLFESIKFLFRVSNSIFPGSIAIYLIGMFRK